MPLDLVAALRFVHILAAILWVGGAAFHLWVLTPAVKAAGPAGGAVMLAAVRRGGFGPYYGTLGLVTIATGGYLYGELGYANDPWATGASTALTVGMMAGVLAFVAALTLSLPLEMRAKKLAKAISPDRPPAPQQVQELQALGAKQVARGWIVLVLILVAVVGMAGRSLFL